ncbi:MAG: ribbon-helix-helix domain-containing protein [Nanoarchaeota archaeon]|nr:ribbon-helix-helix domain-containing protein [Nanoarchaeota archaeon]
MESITIKVEENFADEIREAMNPDYSTKTEFIREAIRDKLKRAREERALEELGKYFGKAKTKTTYKDERRIRNTVGKELAKKFGVRV